MSLLSAILQAFVQGLTEFLPISSSGHLALIEHFTNVSPNDAAFLSGIIHFGALAAVFIAFRRLIAKLTIEFFCMMKDIFTGKFTLKNLSETRRMVVMLIISTIPLLIILPFKGLYDILIQKGSLALLALCFLLTSVVTFFADNAIAGSKTSKNTTNKDALIIGLAQGACVLPGISRFGVTISSSLLCGLSTKYAIQYSFVLGIPALVGSGLFQIVDAFKTPVDVGILPIIIGFIIAAVTAFIAIKFIAHMITYKKLKYFSYYTLALGALVLIAAISEIIF